MEIDLSLLTNTNIHIFFLIIPFFVQLWIFPVWLMFFILFAWANSKNIEELTVLFLIILLSSIAWDIWAYLIAKYFSSSKYMNKLLEKEKFKKIYKISWKYFHKRWNIIIFITRFLITWIWPYINYIVWIQWYKFKKFVKYVILWEIIYSAELLAIWYIYKETFVEYYNIIYISLLVFFILYVIYELKVHIFHKKNKLN